MSHKSGGILLLGLGELGSPVLRHLSSHPSKPAITVLLRPNSASAAQATASGAAVLYADIPSASEQELATHFAPFETVIGCTGMTFPAGTQLKLARAAIAAQVPRYVPWQYGVDYDVIHRGSGAQPLFFEQLDVRNLLRASQDVTQWVIFSVGMFMEFLWWDGFGIVDTKAPAVRCLGSWDTQVTVTCVDDIGKVTALALLAEGSERVANQVVLVAGDTVSYKRVAEIVRNVTGQAVEERDGSLEVLKAELAEDPENGLKKYRVAFGEGLGVSWSKDETWNAKKNVQLVDLEQWARGHTNT